MTETRVFFGWFLLTFLAAASVLGRAPAKDLQADASPEEVFDCYTPVDGGWHIRIAGNAEAPRLEPRSRIGVVEDNPRLHRRPLYPPADRRMIWDEEEVRTLERFGFRPLVLAYNEPRFLFDFHSAGGLLGRLHIGLSSGDSSKWFHQWSELNVSYVDGRMEYEIHDPDFPGVAVSLSAIPLSQSAGLLLKVSVLGAPKGSSLVWAYGGASAFWTNYNMTAPEFSYRPNQSMKDRVAWTDEPPIHRFTLRRPFDEHDVYMQEVFAAPRHLPGWEAVIKGGSSWEGRSGFGNPKAFDLSPAHLANTASWWVPSSTAEQPSCVAVQEIPLSDGKTEGYVAVGMGKNLEEAIRNPGEAWKAATARNASIARRIVTKTPDPYLDAAMRMMAFSTEGTWGDSSVLHGAWSWRYAYLGWRGWYGSTCYGWTDRIGKAIENHTELGLILEGEDEGALAPMLEFEGNVSYNMNEVFLDQVRQYFDYTNDLELMRRVFPALKGIAAWENRRLQPKGEHLYENALNTWISDSHWYIQGQCTQASAYMLRAHTFLADLAERLGEDPAPFREKAGRIFAAMQEKLWMPDRGVFAEYLDTRGHGMLHTEPELPTIYHSAEFGAATPEQVARMLRWVDRNLKPEETPGGGKLVWSSNWFPNRGRSYTHSTHEMAYGEELNLALTNCLAGRSDEAYSLIRGVLCGIFNGPTPGGLSCHCYTDGRQRANDEFADAIGMWGRTVAEGLFGIQPHKPDGYITLAPQFPDDWNEASIRTPLFSYKWKRDDGEIRIEWDTPDATKVRLRLPLHSKRVESVEVDGARVEFDVEPGYLGVDWLQTEIPSAREGRILVRCSPRESDRSTESMASWQPRPPDRVWTIPEVGEKSLDRWQLVELEGVFNAGVTEVLPTVTEKAVAPELPASQVGFNYWKDHLLQYHGSRNEPVSDSAWRAKVGPDGVAWTTDGIPFKTSKEGRNIGVVSLTGAYSPRLEFPVNAKGKTLYLLVGGMSFPVQSHVVNLRVTLHYADGDSVERELVNPFGIGDCWSTWCGRFHDTPANGFENIGGRRGPAGSSEVTDRTQPVELDTEAQLVPFDVRQETELTKVEVEAIANDVVFGVMGATILK